MGLTNFARVFKLSDDFLTALQPNQLKLVLGGLVAADPALMVKTLGQMEVDDISTIMSKMNSADRLKLIQKADSMEDGSTFANKIKQADNSLTGGANKADGGAMAKSIADRQEFWRTVRTGGTGLAGLALLKWVDDKFKDANEDMKDCMAVCVPENWHEYENGNLTKSELKYSTIDNLEERGLAPIPNQPYCTARIDNCGEYCEKKCREETEVDLPGTNILRDGARWGGGLTRDLFGGFFTGLGLGGVGNSLTTGLSISSSMLCLLLVAGIVIQTTGNK